MKNEVTDQPQVSRLKLVSVDKPASLSLELVVEKPERQFFAKTWLQY